MAVCLPAGLQPQTEIVKLEDYQARHALYRLDPGLQVRWASSGTGDPYATLIWHIFLCNSYATHMQLQHGTFSHATRMQLICNSNKASPASISCNRAQVTHCGLVVISPRSNACAVVFLMMFCVLLELLSAYTPSCSSLCTLFVLTGTVRERRPGCHVG